MNEDITPPSQEGDQHGVTGDPSTGLSSLGATLAHPPFAKTTWEAPPKTARMLARGAIITISLTPTMLLIWVLAPDDVKYEIRKQLRWLPWMAKYASWWLRKQGW